MFGMIMGIVNLLSGLSSSRLVCHTRRMSTPSTNRYKNHRSGSPKMTMTQEVLAIFVQGH
jgi:hypothetical protein